LRVGQKVGNLVRWADKRFGLVAWLVGEPRPLAGGFDVKGEKSLDWGWVCANLPRSADRALDVGCGESPVVPAMLTLGYKEVVGVDLQFPLDKHLKGPHFIQGDFNRLSLEPGFDVVVACSTIEHIGLSGRYESTEEIDGDLNAVRKIRSLLKKDGVFILTVPAGEDGVYKPWHRVYGRKRMGQLLEGFQVVKAQGYVKEPWGPWRKGGVEEAIEFPATAVRYALAQMVLRVVSD